MQPEVIDYNYMQSYFVELSCYNVFIFIIIQMLSYCLFCIIDVSFTSLENDASIACHSG